MAKSERKKYGLHGGPIECTRIAVTEANEHFMSCTPPIDSRSCLAVNDNTGVVTSFNQYDGNMGKGATPEGMTQPVPAAESEKWKQWKKKGYEVLTPAAAEAFAVKWATIKLVPVAKGKAVVVKAEAAKA